MILQPFPKTFQEANYPAFYLLSCVTEAQAQAAMLESLRWRGIPAMAVDAGAKKLRGRAWGALKRAGVENPSQALQGQTGAGVAGLVDIIGVIPPELAGGARGVPLFIEMKAPKWLKKSEATGRMIQKAREGLPTIQQLGFLDTMARAGAVCGVAWGSQDLDRILLAGGLAIT